MIAHRILVVEDSPSEAEHIRGLLEGDGHQVAVASDGRKALELVHSVPFDLILSDIALADTDGYTLCQTLKSDPQTKWLPFIFLTERKSALDILKGLIQGADNFIPKPFEDVYLLQRIRRIFEHLELRTQGYRDTEVTLRVDGRQVVITPDKQQIVELLLSTYDDVHQLNARLDAYNKNLEAEVQVRTQQLREAETKYRTLVEQLPAVSYIAAVNGERRLLYVSPQIETLLGFSPDEWLSNPDLWATQLHPTDRQQVLTAYADSVANQTGFSGEYRLLARDAREVWVRTEEAVILDDTAHPKCVQGLMLDVTERKRAEEERQRQREALSQAEKVATLGQVLTGVAHELNNPLTVVVSQTELLRELTRGHALGERVDKVYEAVQRCARIVKNFFALARQRPPERRNVHLNHIIHEAMELLAYPMRVDGIAVHLDLAEELPNIWADPHQLHQVIVNLVSNAHQALRETSRTRQVTISTRYDAGKSRLCLAVADTGPGISPELRSRLFDPFFTTKPPGQAAGLGLSLCQEIVERHGGTINVESTPGEGAQFVVDLPLGADPTAAAQVRTPTSTSAQPAPDALTAPQGRAILVVDDEPGVAEVLVELLRFDGHEVDTASDGVVALRKLAERPYDLILSDLRMPELDGPGLYHALKERHPALCRRMIFLTGDVLTPRTQTFLAETVVPTVRKPFALDEVRRIVRHMLGRGAA
jgi:two-component system NtrC family sensor kinase